MRVGGVVMVMVMVMVTILVMVMPLVVTDMAVEAAGTRAECVA